MINYVKTILFLFFAVSSAVILQASDSDKEYPVYISSWQDACKNPKHRTAVLNQHEEKWLQALIAWKRNGKKGNPGDYLAKTDLDFFRDYREQRKLTPETQRLSKKPLSKSS